MKINNDSPEFNSLPKWAHKLTWLQINDLKECHGGKLPNLAQLLRDINYQEAMMNPGDKPPCWACLLAVKTLRPNHPALVKIAIKMSIGATYKMRISEATKS